MLTQQQEKNIFFILNDRINPKRQRSDFQKIVFVERFYSTVIDNELSMVMISVSREN